MSPKRLPPLRGTFATGAPRRDPHVYDVPNFTDPACATSGVMPDTWHNAGHSSAALADTRAAIAICATCTTREACLAYALEHDIRDGVFGGLTAAERRQLRRNGGAA